MELADDQSGGADEEFDLRGLLTNATIGLGILGAWILIKSA